MLPPNEQAYLDERVPARTVSVEGGISHKQTLAAVQKRRHPEDSTPGAGNQARSRARFSR